MGALLVNIEWTNKTCVSRRCFYSTSTKPLNSQMEDKMLLVFDIGNSNIVMGAYDGKKLYRHWRISTEPTKNWR